MPDRPPAPEHGEQVTGERPRGGRSADVHRIFRRIAGHDDRRNAVVTLGQHRTRRREVAARGHLPDGRTRPGPGHRTGTALETARRHRAATVTGAGFSEEMLRRARARPGADPVHRQRADAARPPFEDETFDGSTEGQLLRNVEHLDAVLREQHRARKPGGRPLILETCPPSCPGKPAAGRRRRAAPPRVPGHRPAPEVPRNERHPGGRQDGPTGGAGAGRQTAPGSPRRTTCSGPRNETISDTAS
ncbi:class I SAM-dependent methyltransferase [Kitasatospora sp. NPDC059646]|uniref:class I SAM-dependent methyltransferase n=1 Tax=Kitasatospora sp. NPDC059646 TaxID=3346893 RepID=UPI00368C28B4